MNIQRINTLFSAVIMISIVLLMALPVFADNPNPPGQAGKGGTTGLQFVVKDVDSNVVGPAYDLSWGASQAYVLTSLTGDDSNNYDIALGFNLANATSPMTSISARQSPGPLYYDNDVCNYNGRVWVALPNALGVPPVFTPSIAVDNGGFINLYAAVSGPVSTSGLTLYQFNWDFPPACVPKFAGDELVWEMTRVVSNLNTVYPAPYTLELAQ